MMPDFRDGGDYFIVIAISSKLQRILRKLNNFSVHSPLSKLRFLLLCRDTMTIAIPIKKNHLIGMATYSSEV